jgi:hypothetical protein
MMSGPDRSPLSARFLSLLSWRGGRISVVFQGQCLKKGQPLFMLIFMMRSLAVSGRTCMPFQEGYELFSGMGAP